MKIYLKISDPWLPEKDFIGYRHRLVHFLSYFVNYFWFPCKTSWFVPIKLYTDIYSTFTLQNVTNCFDI